MKAFKLSVAFLGVVAVAVVVVGTGCSVNQENVVSRPPKIQEKLETKKEDFGTLVPSGLSIFFWPEGLTDRQLEEVVRTVNSASQGFDKAMLAGINKRNELEAAEKIFLDAKCRKFGKVFDEGQDTLVDIVLVWKEIPTTDPDYENKIKLLEKCQANQAERIPILDWLKNVHQNDLQSKLNAVVKAIDPTYPELKNTLSVTAAGSSVVLRPTAALAQALGMELSTAASDDKSTAEITMRNFLYEGNSPTTKKAGPGQIRDAKYSPETRQLVFTVPLAPDYSSSRMEFVLERVPNELGLVRFTGTVKWMAKDRVIRNGIAKIEGAFKKPSVSGGEDSEDGSEVEEGGTAGQEKHP